jgi:putative transposase
VTKYRRKCITKPMLDRLREIAEQRCQDWGGELIEFNGEPDHVHVLMDLPPNLDLSKFVNNLKTTSSRLIRRDFMVQLARVYRKPVFWSRSYCIISCGGAPLSILKQYVENQAAPQ